VSQSSALTKAKALKAVMLDYGVPEVSIELQTGRPNPYDSWDGLFVVIDMSHHIVSNYNSSNLTPLLWLVKQGRTSVPGPLANGYGGWDLCYRILCFSYANHPGAGGPMTVPRVGGGTYTIPKDSARRYAWGTEYEGGVVEADWDRLLKNPRNGRRMTMREFMGRAGAAIHDHFNISFSAHAEHSTWAPLRKIDRLRYNKSEGAAEEKRYADASPLPKDWFDMATLGELKQVVRDVLAEGGDATPYIDGKFQSRDTAIRRGSVNSGNAVNAIKYKVLPELAAIRAAQGGQPVDGAALARDVAALLLPEVREDIRAELQDVDGVDEDAIAERVVSRIGVALVSDAPA
jgi:hypothetical protein